MLTGRERRSARIVLKEPGSSGSLVAIPDMAEHLMGVRILGSGVAHSEKRRLAILSFGLVFSSSRAVV